MSFENSETVAFKYRMDKREPDGASRISNRNAVHDTALIERTTPARIPLYEVFISVCLPQLTIEVLADDEELYFPSKFIENQISRTP